MAIEMTAAEEQRADVAVVFACDEAYRRFASFAAAQVAALPGRDFDICLCSAETMEPVPTLAHHRIRHCRIDTGGIFAGLGLDDRRTEAAYLRYALPAAFAGAYRRLLYLDADVFVQGGDFSALLASDIGAHPLAAVRDNLQWRTPGRRPASFRRLGLAHAPYFNSGVLLIDVAAWNDQDVLPRCLEFARAHPPERIGLDQELVNAVLHGDWAELSPAWNWQYTRSSMLFEAMEEAHVVHFIGPKKPWKHAGGALPRKFRRAYAAFFAAHFPDGPQIPSEGLAPHQNRPYLRRMLFRHFFAVGSFSDYLDRFETPMTVIRRR